MPGCCKEMKNIKMSSLAYEMLLELSKKKRLKPEQLVEQLIQTAYKSK
jgi:hypothetical protein